MSCLIGGIDKNNFFFRVIGLFEILYQFAQVFEERSFITYIYLLVGGKIV